MPLVKIKEKYQVTLPARIRQRLDLKVGDLLEVDLKDQHIILKPKAVVDRDQAWEQLRAVLRTVHNQNKDIDPAQVERDVLAALHRVRRRESKKAPTKSRAR